jgi:hypothetical protein
VAKKPCYKSLFIAQIKSVLCLLLFIILRENWLR